MIYFKKTTPFTIRMLCSVVLVPTNFHFIVLTLTQDMTGWCRVTVLSTSFLQLFGTNTIVLTYSMNSD